MSIEPLYHTDYEKVVLRARGGSVLGDCVREMVSLALHHRITVEMVHNGQLYRVRSDHVDEFLHTLSTPVVSPK